MMDLQSKKKYPIKSVTIHIQPAQHDVLSNLLLTGQDAASYLSSAQDYLNIDQHRHVYTVAVSLNTMLPNGIITGRFNASHTIADLRMFIVNAQPGLAGFPIDLYRSSRMIRHHFISPEEDTTTLKEAQLLDTLVFGIVRHSG